MAAPNEIEFLNRKEDISSPDIWNRGDLAKLWLYNLHYFDDLVAREAHARTDWHRDLITRWIHENPPVAGNGWEPYPTSLRIVNWAKWVLSGHELPEGALDSLAGQAEWLSRNLEYHLLGNHLLANAKALVFAASVIEGAEADRWRRTGLKILAREVPEQQLPDGGHFELSLMYHGVFTEDLLDLVQLAELDRSIPRDQAKTWRDAAARALAWMEGMTHPDGRISFFNDGAFGIAPEPAALLAYAARLGVEVDGGNASEPTKTLDAYVRMTAGPAVLLCDAGPIGPDYLPGHAHADTLSFELSIGEQRIIVNGGTSVYGGAPDQRRFERGTSAHNTVTVDNRDSSETWAEFRVARRAQITERRLETGTDACILTAAHDGFHRFGGPTHRRTWTLTDGSLRICDELDHGWETATALFRIAPPLSTDGVTISGTVPIRLSTEGARLRIEPGGWAPEFGRIVPCQVVCLDFTGPRVETTLSWDR